jgi:hypothetical protein
MTWTIDGCIFLRDLDIVCGSNRIAMIDCENEALSDSDILANAHLIAAAPDLLQALHDADEFCQQGLNSAEPQHWEAALQDIMELVRNAISKAKGA